MLGWFNCGQNPGVASEEGDSREIYLRNASGATIEGQPTSIKFASLLACPSPDALRL